MGAEGFTGTGFKNDPIKLLSSDDEFEEQYAGHDGDAAPLDPGETPSAASDSGLILIPDSDLGTPPPSGEAEASRVAGPVKDSAGQANATQSHEDPVEQDPDAEPETPLPDLNPGARVWVRGRGRWTGMYREGIVAGWSETGRTWRQLRKNPDQVLIFFPQVRADDPNHVVAFSHKSVACVLCSHHIC